MSIPVRLLIIRQQSDQDTFQTDVNPNESLETLNKRLFPDHVGKKIKWIYFGRTIEHRLPDSVSPDSTIHVMITELVNRPVTPRQAEMSLFDKSLLTFIYMIFAIFLALVWKRFHSNPGDFTMISKTILFGFTFIFIFAVINNMMNK